jgi:IclR family pca regulon transcriptional regulator
MPPVPKTAARKPASRANLTAPSGGEPPDRASVVGVGRADQPVSAAERIEAWSGDPNFMTSLARGIAVIRAFTQQKRRLTISQLSQRTGIPRAAVRRCYTLAIRHVNADEARTLRSSALLAGPYLSSTPLTTAAQPLLTM